MIGVAGDMGNRINTPLIRGWIETYLDYEGKENAPRINTPLIRGWIET